MWFVVPSDFLKTYETEPQIIVTVAGRSVVCVSDVCDYSYLDVPDIP